MVTSVVAVTFADEALLNEAPQHIAAVVAVGGLVEGLLAEAMAMPVVGGRLLLLAGGGGGGHRRHLVPACELRASRFTRATFTARGTRLAQHASSASLDRRRLRRRRRLLRLLA